jgi:hypothetical protein
MSDGDPRIGPAREVPPPRPVPPPPVAVAETGLARAARALADAVAGMVAGRPAGTAAPGGTAGAPGSTRSALTGLRDVVGAVAGAVGAALSGEQRTSPASGAGAPEGVPGRDPTALLGDLLAAAAPRLPVRDAARLRQAHPGASDEQIADALVERASRLTSGIGAAAGGLSAAHWMAPPSLLALPLELGAELVLVGAVEVVLIGELHELHGRVPPGDARERAAAYVASWSSQRSVDRTDGLGALLGTAGARALRRQVTRRIARSVPGAAPFLVGAAIARRANRRATESLARKVLGDLRDPRPPHPPGGGRG